MLKDIAVACGASVDQPGDSLESDSHIDNLDRQLGVSTLIVVLVLHEDHISQLEPVDEILDTGTHVSSSCPNILYKGDLLGVDLELLGEPSVVELDGLFLEKDIVIGFVESVDSQHHKT